MPIAFPPTPIYRAPLMSGDAGVEQTIHAMRGLVDEALRDPAINRLARDIVRGVPAFDDYAEANALYSWVRQNIRFTKDPVNKETLYPPAELLQIRAGDCDDISMLLATLLMSVGYAARLMTVAANGDEFSHVYVEGQINGQWVPMDPARSDSQFGVAPPAFTRARWWSLADNSFGELSGTRARHAQAHIGGLGDYLRYRSHVSGTDHMGSYGRVRTVAGLGTLGDCAPGDVWTGSVCITPAAEAPASGDTTSSTIATIAQGGASLIRAAAGQPASPFDFSASGPWQSFQTQYSPYGVPAGYTTPPPAGQVTGALALSPMGWALLGLGAFFIFSMWKHR